MCFNKMSSVFYEVFLHEFNFRWSALWFYIAKAMFFRALKQTHFTPTPMERLGNRFCKEGVFLFKFFAPVVSGVACGFAG